MAGQTVFAEDLLVGESHRLGSVTLTEAQIVEFAAQWDPQSFHIDRSAAREGLFNGIIASGIHTLAVAQRLTVQSVLGRWSVIAGRRLRDVDFFAPVRPDDELSGTVVVNKVDFGGRGRALVTYTTELVNQDNITVLRVAIEAYVRTRPQ